MAHALRPKRRGAGRCLRPSARPARAASTEPGRLDLHDLHHVALDAPPTFAGEIQVGAFEVMTHVPTAYIGFYDYGAVLVGLLVMPLRTLGWLWRYRQCRTFYDQASVYETWLRQPMAELRTFLTLQQ